MEQYGLSFYDADRLTSSRAMADFFEASMDLSRLEPQATAGRAKAVSNWVLGELGRLLNENGGDIGDSTVTPACIVELIDLVEAGTVSLSLAKTVLEEVFASGEAPGKIVRERGYIQISDSSVLGSAVEEAIDANPQAVADYMKGKETAAKFLVGQVMKITRGQAKPNLVNEAVKDRLDAIKSA
jgi:aspartyl-tRNA(Asn)/glutamyl-tRNA(Gln) amidotransferase subunit B